MTFGLLGYPLSHSFSRGYFTDKFADLGLAGTHRYLNFELEDAAGLTELPARYPDLRGINVTIPHKRAVLPYLTELDPAAERIGAVNTILVKEGKLYGFNTDYVGFRDDLQQQFGITDGSGLAALILGTGGAALAVRESLRSLGIPYLNVSRRPGDGKITYAQLSPTVLEAHRLIVNTTPLGMAPKVEAAPALPYDLLGPDHRLYDLVYNPAETRFLREGRQRGAQTANGLGMLHGQAEASWAIWTA